MRLSKKSEYAVRALIEIGLESRESNSRIAVSTLAQRTNIPEGFLSQIILTLRNAGILSSKRGPKSGCRLARPAEEITLGKVVRLLDGPLAPIPCVSVTAYHPCTCPDEASCGLHIAMKQVRDMVAGILDGYKLSRLLREVQKLRSVKVSTLQIDVQKVVFGPEN